MKEAGMLGEWLDMEFKNRNRCIYTRFAMMKETQQKEFFQLHCPPFTLAGMILVMSVKQRFCYRRGEPMDDAVMNAT